MKLVLFFTLFLILSVFGQAQNAWVGSYEFDEDGGRTSGGTAILVNHRIDITETDDGLIAMIKSSGFQTSRDLVGKARADGDKLLIHFAYYGEDNMLEPYNEGDLLFTLERKKKEILTFWGKFLPVVEKNEKTGKVYFRKMIEVKADK